MLVRKAILIGAATLLGVSLAAAQSSAPSSTAGGAVGTPKVGTDAKQGKVAKQKKKSAGKSSSPESTAGGAVGTSKSGKQ